MTEEREIKLAVPEHFELPELTGVAPGIDAVDRGTHALDAVYWDTDTLALVGAGFGLRHRTTDGADGRWTLKGATRPDGPALVREETEVEGRPDQPPPELLAKLPPDLGTRPLRPVVALRTLRHTVDLMDGDGVRRAEVADDRVRILDGATEAGSFREVEVELIGDPDSGLIKPLLERLRGAGAGEPESTAKYVRALRAVGYHVPDGARV